MGVGTLTFLHLKISLKHQRYAKSVASYPRPSLKSGMYVDQWEYLYRKAWRYFLMWRNSLFSVEATKKNPHTYGSYLHVLTPLSSVLYQVPKLLSPNLLTGIPGQGNQNFQCTCTLYMYHTNIMHYYACMDRVYFRGAGGALLTIYHSYRSHRPPFHWGTV